jgi:hypothetical protein
LPPLVAPVVVRAPGCQLRRAATDRIVDLPREARVAERPAAIGRRPQPLDEFAVEREAEERAIFLAARVAAAPERTIDRMLAEQRVGGAVGMRPVARSAIGARVIGHPAKIFRWIAVARLPGRSDAGAIDRSEPRISTDSE